MLVDLANIMFAAMLGNLNWIKANILFSVPWSQNYFWGLTLISAVVWLAECLVPWRKEQGTFRKDFWLDAFYMYFNFFGFSVVVSGIYQVVTHTFSSVDVTTQSLALFQLRDVHPVLQLLVFFLVLDFLQWCTHVTIHRVNFLWRFHQVHHSIKEMGFAGHLRYHWAENIIYKPARTLGVMLLGGFEPEQAFIVHFFTTSIGHINHSNLKLSYGPLKYILNNPVMHLYHHAYSLPKERKYGANFGLTLSVWDYLFGTAYVPEDGGKIKLGYPGDEQMPSSFLRQLVHGFKQPSGLKNQHEATR